MKRRAVSLAAMSCALWLGLRDARAGEPEPRATLYAFFATWCVPCRVELPHIERLHREYAGRGLRVVLVSEDAPSTAANVPAFLARFDVTAPWELDSESELLARYHPAASVPFTALVDDRGRITYAHAGYEPGDEAALEQAVVDVLAEGIAPAASTPDRDVTVTAALQTLAVRREDRFDPNNPGRGRLNAAAARLEVQGRAPRYNAAARIDGAALRDFDATMEETETDARLERASLGAELGPVRLRAGDSYAAFGHGVSLSLRKVDPLGVDTTVQGARADVRAGRVTATALAGFANPQNLDPIELRVVDPVEPLIAVEEGERAVNTRDRLAGAEVRVALSDTAWAGPYGLVARADGAAPDGADVTWAIGGAAAQMSLGKLRLAADGAAGRRDGLRLSAETAWAGYAAAELSAGPARVLVEGKAYRRWMLGRPDANLLYHEPPTLEREDQEVPGNADAAGARVRAEWRARQDVTAFANALAYKYALDGTDPFDGKTALHGYAGAELRPHDAVSTSATLGYRLERNEDDSDRLRFWHVDADVAWSVGPRLALTGKLNLKREDKALALTTHRFDKGLAVVGAAIPGRGALSVLYGYSTEAQTDDVPTHYPAVELRWLLPRGGDLRLFYGRLLGGRVCVSGSCRDVPPFEGLRLDAVVRY